LRWNLSPEAIRNKYINIFVLRMKSIDRFLNSISNKKLLVVYPHPDDESVMAGGLIQRALSLGFWVTVLTITEGGKGKIHVNGRGRSVMEIRREEMASAMSILGVADWVMWKFPDGELRKTTVWRERLRRFILETKPGLIVSYDLSGVTGHPDHISLALEVYRAAKKLKTTKLLWTSFVGEMKDKIVGNKVTDYLQTPEYVLNLDLKEAGRKWRAVFAHKSQDLGKFLRASWWWLLFIAREEWYSEADLSKKYRYRYVRFKI
jgi:LmbE family N-acetylglucosaminyl deacetylase